MNIKGVGYVNGINYYNRIASNKVNQMDKIETLDRIELSKEGKLLNDYRIDESIYDNSKKVENIKNMIQNGTYNCDAKLIAKGMLDSIKDME